MFGSRENSKRRMREMFEMAHAVPTGGSPQRPAVRPALGIMSSYRLGYSGVSGNPVDFPRLAFVGGKCLLEST